MAKKRKRIVAKFALAPSRSAFLLAVEINVLMLAKRLKQLLEKKPNEVKKFWEKFGGNFDKLKKAIDKGIKHEYKGLGIVVTTAVVTSAITTALPIITAVLKLFKTHKSDKEGDDKNDTKGLNLITTTITNDPSGTNTGVPTKTIDDQKEVKSYTKPLLIGGAILIGGYFLMKNKNK
ncbi:MAG: hypothetical protein WCO54_08830 [Bacteroidota bacterium]